MTIIAKDTQTGKTGLLHLADDTDPQKLNDFFNELGTNSAEIKLVGVRRYGKAIEKYHDFIKNNPNRTDTIISADVIYEHDLPRTVVVDPQTFRLEEAIPAKNSQISSPHQQLQSPSLAWYSQSMSAGKGF
jgi:predicted nicotinamide N-methyase